MNNRHVESKIMEFASCKEEEIIKSEQGTSSLTFENLRDILLSQGLILDEDFERQIYTIRIMSGVLNLNPAIIAIQLRENKLFFAGYAREGLIKQHTAERALERVKQALESREK